MKYFTIKELSHSDTAVARGIDNTPTGEAVHNLTELVETSSTRSVKSTESPSG